MSSKTSASWWSTSTSWRPIRLARSFSRKSRFHLDSCYYFMPYSCICLELDVIHFILHQWANVLSTSFTDAVTRLRLAAQRQRRPANAERSGSWPRRKRCARKLDRRGRSSKEVNLNGFLSQIHCFVWLINLDNCIIMCLLYLYLVT